MPSPALLSVQRVTKSFGALRAVDGVEFDARPGEVLGFLGPNGAGKTTTLRMILQIIRPDSGTILFKGGPSLDRTRVGYLPEERGLFEDAGVLDTLVYLGTLRGMSRAAARSAAKRWLARLELADRAGAKLGTLSKGNQQKVQFLGAVLHGPELAVLDEPFSGLDPLNQELFIALIGELRDQGAAVLLSAHQLDLVERLCDRFYLISRGRPVLAGTLDEIRRDAVQGADELVLLELASRSRSALPAPTLTEAVRGVAPEASVQLREAADGRAQLEISLRPGADLGPILNAVGAHAAIERVQTRRLSLHEIYLRAVGPGGEARADAPEATHV